MAKMKKYNTRRGVSVKANSGSARAAVTVKPKVPKPKVPGRTNPAVTAAVVKATKDWKAKASKAATPAAKQEILLKRAASVGRIGAKAVLNLKELKAKEKDGSISAEEKVKLTNLQARHKAASKKAGAKKSTAKKKK